MTNTGPWKMPEDLKPFESFFRDLGAFSVEALMNLYGAKCAHRPVKAGENPNDPEAADLRAVLCNAQVGLLVALKGAGLLSPQWRVKTPPFILIPEPPCFIWYRLGPRGSPILCAWNGEMATGCIPSWGTSTTTEVLAWCPAPVGPPGLVAEYKAWVEKFQGLSK